MEQFLTAPQPQRPSIFDEPSAAMPLASVVKVKAAEIDSDLFAEFVSASPTDADTAGWSERFLHSHFHATHTHARVRTLMAVNGRSLPSAHGQRLHKPLLVGRCSRPRRLQMLAARTAAEASASSTMATRNSRCARPRSRFVPPVPPTSRPRQRRRRE